MPRAHRASERKSSLAFRVVSVIVLSVQGQKVRLGIIAPQSVRVDRRLEIRCGRGELEGTALDDACTACLSRCAPASTPPANVRNLRSKQLDKPPA